MRLLCVCLLICSTVSAAEVIRPDFGDFAWMHGANYTPSYAATDVQTWLEYDHQTVDRELGYARQIGLTCRPRSRSS